jgi:DtxR family Mn-dependent transcriptional regulator
MLAENLEEILEAIWVCHEQKRFSQSEIQAKCADELTSADLDELERQGLVVRAVDKVLFTEAGRVAASAIIRRHRLAEVLVSSILKLPDSVMEQVACKAEHGLLPEVEESICTLLGHPDTCPHGMPIPRGSCCQHGLRQVENVVVGLNELKPSEAGKIAYLKPGDHGLLHQLIALGIQPGTLVTVHRRSPAFCIKFDNTEIAIDEELVRRIFVWRVAHHPTEGQ